MPVINPVDLEISSLLFWIIRVISSEMIRTNPVRKSTKVGVYFALIQETRSYL